MKAELKAQWVAALRSGDYKQGRYRLQEADGFCCMGVLCVVAGWPTDDRDGSVNSAPYDPVREAIGGLSAAQMLSRMNDRIDDGHKSFDEIADWIEQHIPVDPS
jgi:hypothetical protein